MRRYGPRRSLGERLYTFMIGRNGTDALGRATTVAYIVLLVVNLFIRNWIASLTVYGLACLLCAWTVFRMLSRDLPARRRENGWYLRVTSRLRHFFRLQKNKWRDRKTHVYRTCPQCKKTLRLPKQKGEHTVSCPCCRHRFKIKI